MRSANPFRRFARTVLLAAAFAVLFTPALVGPGRVASAAQVQGADGYRITAMHLAGILKAARAVISDSQDIINDHTMGDKGITGEVVLQAAKMSFSMAEGEYLKPFDMANLDTSTRPGKLIQALLDSIVEVVDGVQERINRKNVGFKGFLPSVFTAEVAERFKVKVGRLAEIRLTAPVDYVRNRAHMPDKWEHEVIEGQLRSPEHPMGEHVSEFGLLNGRPAYRMISPEYYEPSCLACHGEPKGKRDITGGKKEGGKLGELGGAISVVIFQ
ncbi:MAG: DUF3365 domain-containing protein [Rhodospirillales bacterium]|nr:DUF3365 domain-containing protein [Rhodospirillales bacterium]MDH3913267.1 DUF3365 domain-containing protein [Rhodospirillales bacterium]MDH3969909.1 DUF3365 domain-containing protein [Rhodospirillales bacterium]